MSRSQIIVGQNQFMQTTELHCVFASQRPQVPSGRAFWPMTIILCLAFAVLIAVGEAKGHELEDGFVERSVAVVVRDNVARMEYSIGLNPNTRQQLIAFWHSTDVDGEEIESDQGEITELVQQKPDFYQLAADHVSRRLEIFVDNQPVQPKLISALQSSRHHVDVTVTLEFSLPESEAQIPVAIEIDDGNFFRGKMVQEKSAPATLDGGDGGSAVPQKTIRAAHRLAPAPFGGGFRYAFKTAGSTVLSSSNVASILIRADRHLDNDFTDAELDHALRIKAEVANILATRSNH